MNGLNPIRKLGTFGAFGLFGSPTTADWSIIGDRRELNIHSVHLGPYGYPLAIDCLYRGVVDADALMTHRLPLERFTEGMEILLRYQDHARAPLSLTLTSVLEPPSAV